MTVFLDTNVIVAACVAEHEHHSRALPWVQSVHSKDSQGFVSAHGIIEVYAILTRLPRSPRILPSQAATLIDENIVHHFSVVALTSREYGEMVLKAGRSGIVGGQSYDALHLQCAEKSGADRIFTFNVRHFTNLAPHLAPRIAAP